MKSVTKLIAGAATAALLTVSLAAPAEAQYRNNYRHHDNGIDAGDVVAGVAIVGGIAAIASAIGRDGSRYGYGYGSSYGNQYRGGYNAAVQACGYEAQRYGRGGVQVTDVERTGNDRFRVRGVIGGGYDRYDRGVDQRYERDYGRYDRGDAYDRDGFVCTVRGNGRVTDFRVRDTARNGW
ncbi:MAG: hypothetical protein E6G94_07645 [Alphaproteobacteria bacterium]|nr:MAG: hypothetical protein E6G94_07645 [Alphaproteobacteria bacterium]